MYHASISTGFILNHSPGGAILLKYQLQGLALKFFALNETTRDFYRTLGNRYGGPLKRREVYTRVHRERGDTFLRLCAEYGISLGAGKALEIGTGWVNWHSVYHRLHAELSITMLDIWDCRQFRAFTPLFQDLQQQLTSEGGYSKTVLERLQEVCNVTSFEELYSKFNLDYVVDNEGSLDRFSSECFDQIFSFHVLEHVPEQNINSLVRNMFRTLKPGAHSVHQIGIDDHLAHHDKTASPKQYICYSDNAWKSRFENTIQYFNRTQMSEWLKAYSDAGFELLHAEPVYTDISSLKISDRFKKYSIEDLQCITLTIVHRKPFQS